MTWTHVFACEPEPEAVITRLWGPFWDVNVRFGIGHALTCGGWTCAGRRWAEWKARRELAKLVRPQPPTYTFTL